MADEKQSFANHTRWDPGFHFTLMPIAAVTEILLVRNAWNASTPMAWWIAFVGLAAIWGLLKMRLYSLKVQDRVIRLEERLRLATLLPADLRGRIPEFTEGQLVALRFASDAELSALAQRCLNEKLEERKVIKQAIKEWRGDHFRV